MSLAIAAPSAHPAAAHFADPPLIAIIGAGPAGLMAAEVLAAAGRRVRIFDRMPSPARKFLMAGRGGLNLTHSEPLSSFLSRYGPEGSPISSLVESFPPEALRAWAEGLGQPTFTGTSGRVFPKALKASPLLRAWLRRLSELGVELHQRHRWTGWTDSGSLAFETPGGHVEVQPAAAILALGGASWPRLGSDGLWTEILDQVPVPMTPLGPFNAGVVIPWSEHLIERFAGTPLKRIALTCAGRTVRGEAVLTRSGLEGGCVYALNDLIRREFGGNGGRAELHLDLRPDLELHQLTERLSAPRGRQSLATFLQRKANLAPAVIALAREPDGKLPDSPAELALHFKQIKLGVTGLSPIDRAISTSGGISWQALDNASMLRARPGVFCAGEMLDWHAPTGGYLLQGVFASGVAAAKGALSWLSQNSEHG